MLKHLFFLFIWIVSLSTSALSLTFEEALKIVESDQLEQNRQWLKLMHFETDYWGVRESQVDGEGFFFSPDGKQDPKAELIATLKSFYPAEQNKSETEDQNPICRFPARYLWWSRILKSKGLAAPEVGCPRYDVFRKSLKSESATLVFSSYYLNNPSSAFGHTFLRLNKAPSAKDGKRYELLDYGINYAARATTGNALVYAVYGLFGMFPGVFTSVPYYFKVREYNDFDSRDLWEYDLNLAPEAMEMIIAHIWELGPNRIDYWYLTENCSYHMLSIIEAADPRWHILENLKTYVIPADTTSAIWNIPGLVKTVHYRPALRSVFKKEVDLMSVRSRKRLADLVYNKKFFGSEPEDQTFTEIEKSKILDAAIDEIDFRHPGADENSESYQFKKKILLQRSETPVMSDPVTVALPESESPHLAHSSRRVGLGFSSSQYLIDHRFALHDHLDPTIGYPEYSQISFFDTQLTVDQLGGKIDLENFSAFEVRSISPWTDFFHDRSWNIKLGAEKFTIPECMKCSAGVFRGGAGLTYEILPSTYTFFGLGGGLYGGPRMNGENWMIELHPYIGAKIVFSDTLKVLMNVQYLTFNNQNVGNKWNSSIWDDSIAGQWSFGKNGLRATVHYISDSLRLNQTENLVQYFYYY